MVLDAPLFCQCVCKMCTGAQSRPDTKEDRDGGPWPRKLVNPGDCQNKRDTSVRETVNQ